MLERFKILYAEDEDFIRENVVEALEFMSGNVTAVENGKLAYEEYAKIHPDIVIADIEMPGLNGLQLAEKIRKNNDKTTQIIITTAYTNTEYFLKAVELNLVKYLLKPISLIDLKQALQKCIAQIDSSVNILKYFSDDTCYDTKNHKLMSTCEEIKLDYHERAFLELLLKSSHRVVSYQEMENTIWENGMSSAAVRSLVRNLRQKLPDGTIENISKIGYKIILKES